MVLNAVKGIMSVIFPLISFPYVTRVLGVEGIGQFNFSYSVISYFLLIAALGISAYARREGSAIRKDKAKLSAFASQMFSLNLITTVIAYVLLFGLLAVSTSIRSYSNLILILSVMIILTTFGVEWVYMIFEDYMYITVRSIFFQALSLALLLIFVKSGDDLVRYTWITVISIAGSSILNFIHSFKYLNLRFTLKINAKKHFPPILVFWASTLAVTIYVNSDVTILGLLSGDTTVGIYSVSVKVYNVVKIILASVIVVTIPRLSAYAAENQMEKFIETAQDVYKTIITVTLPAVVGVCIFCKEIVYVLSGVEYFDAYSSLFLLSISLICYMLAYFWGQCILVPLHKEKISLLAAVISAVVNLGLNFVLIPLWDQDAAAFTTILGEGTAMIICMHYSRKIIKLPSVTSTVWKSCVGCAAVAVVTLLCQRIIESMLLRLAVGILISVLVYFAIQIVLKNDATYFVIKKIKKK